MILDHKKLAGLRVTAYYSSGHVQLRQVYVRGATRLPGPFWDTVARDARAVAVAARVHGASQRLADRALDATLNEGDLVAAWRAVALIVGLSVASRQQTPR